MIKIPPSRLTTIALPTASTPIVGPSTSRKGIVFYTVGADYYSIGNEPLASADVGVLVISSGGRVEFDLERHGDIVQKGWFAFGHSAITIVFLEVFM